MRDRILISNEISSSPFPSKGDYMHSFVYSASIYWAFPLCRHLPGKGYIVEEKKRKDLQNMSADGYLGLEILWLNWQWSVFLIYSYFIYYLCHTTPMGDTKLMSMWTCTVLWKMEKDLELEGHLPISLNRRRIPCCHFYRLSFLLL